MKSLERESLIKFDKKQGRKYEMITPLHMVTNRKATLSINIMLRYMSKLEYV